MRKIRIVLQHFSSKSNKLHLFDTIESLQNYLNNKRLTGKTIGFVPTMGALHDGHTSLVHTSVSECDVTVVSIFVNPTQFNSLEDLEKYPRTVEEDVAKLETNKCDAVFIPSVLEIYPNYPQECATVQVDLGELADVMEGKFRPGHFEGVMNVVFRLFEIVHPNRVFFGEKDFQQLAVIQKMVDELQLPVHIVPCETLRTSNGLAMSSRNMRLSPQGLQEAEIIYATLAQAKVMASKYSPKEVIERCKQLLAQSTLELEYLEIAHPKKLYPLSDHWVEGARCFIAAYCEGVRLIDNMALDL